MKKHFKAYVTGFNGAKELRAELMSGRTPSQVVDIIRHSYPQL
jgi:tRNA-dihydrouridine synthase